MQQDEREERFLNTARRYIADITPNQEALVRTIARCNRLNQSPTPTIDESLKAQNCFCSLCIILAIHETYANKMES